METPEETILPKSWMWTRLGEIIEKIPLTNKKLKQKEYQQEGKLPVIDQGQVFIGGYTDKEELKISCVSSLIIFGDHTKVVKFVNFDFVAGADGVKVIRPQKVYNPKLFYFFIQAIPLPNKGYARHFQFLEKSSIPLPPLAEQHRIVTKIEELFTQLDAGVEGLKKIQVQLKRYRQSVLKSACEGRLVPTEAELARAEGRDYEPADVLLERILGERRRKWGENNKGKKAKYKEPTAPDTRSLSELPEGWIWKNIDQIGVVSGGFTKNSKRSKYPKKMPYIRVANVYSDKLELDDINNIGINEPEIDRVLLKKGDLLVVEGNGSIDQIGRVALWDGSISPCVHQNHIIKVRFNPVEISKYMLLWLLSINGRKQITDVASSTSGLYTLSISKVSSIFIPFPPLAEQYRIVAEVERHLSVSDEIKKTVDQNLKQAERLRQSILKKAFEGKLVPQNPDDEPASVLLERIQKEINKQNNKPKRSKKRDEK